MAVSHRYNFLTHGVKSNRIRSFPLVKVTLHGISNGYLELRSGSAFVKIEQASA